jgi:hypothetical protein
MSSKCNDTASSGGQAMAEDIDMQRRQALRRLGKAAYVAPAITILPMEKLMAAASSQGCQSSTGQASGCGGLFR